MDSIRILLRSQDSPVHNFSRILLWIQLQHSIPASRILHQIASKKLSQSCSRLRRNSAHDSSRILFKTPGESCKRLQFKVIAKSSTVFQQNHAVDFSRILLRMLTGFYLKILAKFDSAFQLKIPANSCSGSPKNPAQDVSRNLFRIPIELCCGYQQNTTENSSRILLTQCSSKIFLNVLTTFISGQYVSTILL